MRSNRMHAAVVTLLAIGAPAMLAAPQQQVSRPGEMTRAEVWIQNREPTDAIPVTLPATTQGTPLPVQVMTAPNIVLAATSVTQVRAMRQAWEYRQLLLKPGQDAAAALNIAGQDGWETTGVTMTSPAGVAVILKRLR